MKHFQHFKTDISNINLPEKFTFPFYYEPHDLAKIAVKELQEYLENQRDFQHDFGLQDSKNSTAIGKMFGVLVVQNKFDEIGFLAAFSGKLADHSLPEKFVPPVFNMRTEGSFYIKGEAEIDAINRQISVLKNDEVYISLKKSFKKLIKIIDEDLAEQRKKMKISKTERKIRKKVLETSLSAEDIKNFSKKLEQESYNDQFFYRELQEYYTLKTHKIQSELDVFEQKINALKKERKEKSITLQQQLFSNYTFLNQQKEPKSLLDIFNFPTVKPPAGSGECAAPKLLQYALLNDLKPICMAEFWWGISPNSEIRKHKNLYPACQSRCKPILSHMLQGITMDENLLIENLSEHQEIAVIYEDDELIVVNKPAEFLSVPGKEISDSVYTRMKEKYPEATGPLIVHRLDMSTSGILVLTKTKEAHKILQSQFIKRTVKKRYVALLDGKIQEKSGKISLPIRLDLDDRPKQLVDFEFGKKAETFWEIIQIENDKTRVYFYPITGRTHQLRVHAAHKKGLNAPIVGDDLYGKKATRLCLHAEFIEFVHPSTNEKMSFTIAPDF
ncbi:MAG: RNA pseudouridine synthase [Flavobacteriaceae bacterium CG_4_10_14_0_8_um_filter_31_99]|nr:MAG: RNA pseudouridine synthase [Flavobacteriaceae bacterium CG2_30_31_66]PIV97241.1 MAG: RNA pseudouridine synthase [Flavobacteriaceae bacterium CG17_big_fil_post_rev_8_21_14_2_50_31_13]PIX11028.1 MAG: RNA pseudouridine synthase [Flavobacteriaceae bacterium CG_4_8_14_3_um_filter_31_8]PIZ12310.1 MAG: RNA pseudouridine synthase [Flavobacteriaceae bacterium CG_4_10_14_0_8_um_filter_31_99]PJC09781.1 MAG: RNA pseudouridine synthase [Flavobacteriaceae bacterium CG_4_9_14_0_8_um_filter_31_91]